jgi:tRNA threonylcarbamoyladenosine biosynthesis protein TsaE
LDGRFLTYSERETFELGKTLAKSLKDGDIVELEGRLGAGKTVFAKGIASGLGIMEEVTSPTFTLLKEYEGRLKLHHFDLYRIENQEELREIGFYDYLGAEGVCVIEWAGKASLPYHIRISLEVAGENERLIDMSRKDS